MWDVLISNAESPQRDFLLPYRSRLDQIINFDWGIGAPVAGMPQVDDFSVRWDGYIVPDFTETHTFTIAAAGDVRFYVGPPGASPVDVTLSPPALVAVIDAWPSGGAVHSVDLNVKAGVYYPIRIEYHAGLGVAQISLSYTSLSIAAAAGTASPLVVPVRVLYPPQWHPVAASPYRVIVSPSPTLPHACVATGVGLSAAVAAVVASFQVLARDLVNSTRGVGGDSVITIGRNVALAQQGLSDVFFQGAARFGVGVTCSARRKTPRVVGAGSVADGGKGVYTVTYTPVLAGLYQLFVAVNAAPVSVDLGVSAYLDSIAPNYVADTPFMVRVRLLRDAYVRRAADGVRVAGFRLRMALNLVARERRGAVGTRQQLLLGSPIMFTCSCAMLPATTAQLPTQLPWY